MKSSEELKTELKALKAKYGTVYSIETVIDSEKPEEKATIFLRKFDRMATDLVRKKVHESVTKGIEAALRNLYIGGDQLDIVIGSVEALLSCEPSISEMMNVQEATLKKN